MNLPITKKNVLAFLKKPKFYSQLENEFLTGLNTIRHQTRLQMVIDSLMRKTLINYRVVESFEIITLVDEKPKKIKTKYKQYMLWDLWERKYSLPVVVTQVEEALELQTA